MRYHNRNSLENVRYTISQFTVTANYIEYGLIQLLRGQLSQELNNSADIVTFIVPIMNTWGKDTQAFTKSKKRHGVAFRKFQVGGKGVCVWVLFDLVFQPVERENGCRISLLYLLPADIRTLKRGARKAEMLVKGWGMGRLSKASN